MANKSFLDSIQSPLPCSKDWNEMTGDDLKRFCQGCAKNVYNLSAMPRKEARKFVALNAGKVCVRYVRLPNGKVLTADTKLYKITRRASQIAAGVFSATLTISAVANAQTQTPPKSETNKIVKSQKNNSQTSQISFTVYDTNNSPIPTAEVKLTDPKTEKEFTALTNSDGVANFSLIPQGKYEVEISKSYFKPAKHIIQIKEQIEPNIEVQLEIGTITGVITIDWYEIPLFQAISQEDNEVVKNLIKSGFKVNTKDSNNNTALHIAVEHNNLEIVRFLLERGAEVNAKNKFKETPLLMLEDNLEDKNTLEILRLLISKGANVNVQNEQKETVLMMACDEENIEAVKILLEAGANPNLKDEDGETALEKTDSEEIKNLLKQYGAKE